MDKPKTTPKDFFLWAGAMIAFYWSVFAFVFLLFNYINYAFPNPLSYYPADPYQSGISYQMASIIVLFPLYLWLMSLIRKDIFKDASRSELWVRRWLLILTLFIAGITIAVDLITLLTTFLSGEAITVAFVLKVLTVLLVASAVFMHFIADLRGYWTEFPRRRNMVGVGVTLLAIVAIVSGFFIVGTPAEARLARFDQQKIYDLQNIQSQIIGYWQAKQKLPVAIEDLNSSLSYGPVPIDPQSGDMYGYEAVEGLTFTLCADFNTQSRSSIKSDERTSAYPKPMREVGLGDNWEHEQGLHCFERTIDPSFYPPLGKTQP